MRQETQKITAILPKKLLQNAMKASGLGITETIKDALERTARQEAYKGLLEMRGKFKFDLDLNELRKDRDEP